MAFADLERSLISIKKNTDYQSNMANTQTMCIIFQFDLTENCQQYREENTLLGIMIIKKL